ncbi:MAG TPA: TIGR03790 family protein [Bryobacteraceae bacterium]|jgi:uncharacterized protein (TIGR03790 family)
MRRANKLGAWLSVVLGIGEGLALAQGPASVLVVANDNSSISRRIADYYMRRRAIPARNLCRIRSTEYQDVARVTYDREIAGPIGACLKSNNLIQSVFYIVTTSGVPLRIDGTGGMGGNEASVDSELAALYYDLTRGKRHPVEGSLENPFYGKSRVAFGHPQFPMYLVTRLAAYDEEGAERIVDQSMRASNRGKFVVDLNSGDDHAGNNWLRTAAVLLPKDRVIFDESPKVLYNQTDVIGYASWGSNDPHRHRRFVGFHWLPGAIMTEYVSTDGRTFERPPENWNISDWQSRKLWFYRSPQTLTADYILEGATGASGHVYEPYLGMTPRPDLLLPAYYGGRNLAESYYLAIPRLSWQNIVVGDPLCSLGKP